ncbi:LacI family DNA-binding transcriptional regulator [Flavobacterium granuli]|uniref:LacI family transcriptional regulator n=1 Tax=Flavobacterium granuli TaxID=280093 RepID=A0A1M5M217_9FLAO|nr:substrate-binding domain-containing protein [Flavobacterium granuli]PRZ24187.1 LacI family transcriptional regulator [Flavobacterium granuli]SHG71347.1 transcriptional regulator, LacI family [Flavobacterium granuli]
MDKKLTIKDIARLAGVSKGTVDRVLHKRGKVSQKAFDSVNAVLNEMDYEPNLIARNLKNNKIYSISVVIPDPSFDSYWLPCVRGIEEAIREFKAFNLSIKTHYFNPESTKSFINVNETVLALAPDAVLLAPLFYKEALNVAEKYHEEGIIVNTFNNQVQSEAIKNFVGQDLYQSGRVAARLLDLLSNNEQLAIIHLNESYKNAVHMQEKERGFRTYFSENNGQDSKIITLKLKNPSIETNLVQFLEENPNVTGVFITTSKAYQIAKIIGETEHRKIAIIGYDLIEENVAYLKQGTIDFLIHQNPKRQAYLGITCLVDHFIFSKEIPKTTLLPIDIVNSENASFYME